MTRWTVIDEQVINPEYEPDILFEEEILLVEQLPTPDYPVAVFSLNRVTDRQLQLLEVKERNIQQYRPRWFLATLGLSAATIAVLAANTTLLPPKWQSDERLLLNIAAPITAALSLSIQKPVGEPVFTGETEFGRPSGYLFESDTLRVRNSNAGKQADLELIYEDEIIASRINIPMENGLIELNLALLTEELSQSVTDDSVVKVQFTYDERISRFDIPVTSFLSPYVVVVEPVAQLRSAPEFSELNILSEVGMGSRFLKTGADPDGWFRVRFGGTDVYLPESSTQPEWRSVFVSGIPDVFEFRAVPFGQIDVERSVPVLKEHNPSDRAIILTNAFSGDQEPRQYLDRDHDLFLFYMRSAFQLNNEQISVIEMDSDRMWMQRLEEITPADSSGSLYIYLSGDAFLKPDRRIGFKHLSEGYEEDFFGEIFLRNIERIGAGSVFLFADLQFLDKEQNVRISGLSRSESLQILATTAEQLTQRVPDSVVLFSNRPGQTSSIFAGGGVENRRHHIFNYYLAQALQQRRIVIEDIINHMESNVDYMSRRLHDRPQEIEAFGNLTLRITGK